MNCKGDQPVKGSELRQVQTAPVVVAIDDDRVILRAIAKTLASAGMVCHTATTGAAGLRLIREHQADLVLLDILLVGEDGFTLCREIRRTWSPEQLPVIMVTGLEDLESIKAAYASGANDFLAKPLHWKHLPYRIWHVLQASRDITERKQAEVALRENEDRFRTLVEWMPDALGVHRDGKLLYANAAAISMYGASSAKDLVGRSIFDLIHPDFHQSTLERIANSPAEHLRRGMIAARHLKLDGTPIEVETESTLITYDGEPSTLVVVRDITERIKLEAEKASLEAQIHQRQKAESLSRMAGAIAHHFNNKLQSVMANLELMSELPNGMDPAQYLTRAKRATEKAAEVSRLLLLYLGQGSGRGEPLFLAGLCRDSLAHLQSTLPDTVTLEADYPSPGPVIRANADQIQQILASLVANAREAIDDARGSIRLGLSTCPGAAIPAAYRFPIGWQPQEPDYACLEVTDTGCGIVDTDIERLFDPFFSTKFTGRGLGLPVVLGIVQGHGGAITVESKPGHGSVFRTYLPICTEARLPMPEMGGLASAPEGVGTILLVDDDEGLLMATGALIERMGFTLLTAKDGAEAVEVFRQHKTEIRVVITDLTMPKMDGWETLTALRQIDPAMPVVLASGYDKTQVLSGAHADLPQAFLSKPFGLQQLRDAVGQALAAQVPKD